MFVLGQIWGNLISYLVLKPKEKDDVGMITDAMKKYDKCGVEFSEDEYRGVEVANQVEPRTVEKH